MHTYLCVSVYKLEFVHKIVSSTTPNIKDNKLKQQVNMDQVTQQLEAIFQTANQSTLCSVNFLFFSRFNIIKFSLFMK